MSQINAPQPFVPDKRDWDSWRDRILSVEQENAELRSLILSLQRQFALFMQGSKERFDVLSLLLERTQRALDRKDVER